MAGNLKGGNGLGTMHFFSRGAAAMGLVPAALVLSAQPVCSINIGPDLTICQGQTTQLQGPAGYTNYLWSTGATTPSITVGNAGDHWCQVSYPSGELVTNGNFSGGNTGFTSQYTYSLFSVQNEGYYTVGPNASWYHPQFQGTGNGNFLIANGGWVSWVNNQWDVWCQTIPCCPGQTYTLSFRGRTLTNELPATAVWSMNGATANWPDFTFPTFNAGWQTFTTTWTAGPGQTSVNACIRITSLHGVGDDFGIDDISISGMVYLRDTLHVSVTPSPSVDLGPDQALCDGDELDLDATFPGATYLWQDGSTGPTFHVDQAGTYSVDVTAQGCTGTDQVTIQYTPVPTVQLGNDTALCDGSTLNLSVPGTGYTYLWQDGSTNPTFLVNGPGLYWVEAEASNCTARDSIQVDYNPMPTVQLGNDTTLCDGGSLLLDATVPGATYLWQDGLTSPTRVVTASGLYEVEVDLNGCTAQGGIQVAFTPDPAVDLGPDQTICPGDLATFDASTPGATYLWNTGDATPQLVTGNPGTYSVEVAVGGCIGRDTVALSLFNVQTVDLGPDLAMCAGASVRIGASIPGATYLWDTGATTDSITVSGPGIHWLEATLNGCTARDSILITEIPLPAFSLGADQAVCPGQTILLDATTTGASYLWNNGATTPVIQAGAGTWAVEVTVGGCTGTDAITISEHVPPTVQLGPDTTLCPGETITLDATQPGATYVWNTGASTPAITISTPTTASVVVTDGNGCTGHDTIIVSYADPGLVSLGPDIAFCSGSTVRIGLQLAGATYQWNTGATTDSITVGSPGTYWVDVILNGCTVRDSILVGENPSPQVFLPNGLQVCPGATITLDASTAGASYLWSTGATTASINAGAGTWWVEVAVSGCTGSDTTTITGQVPPMLDLGPDTLLCPGESLTIDATQPGASYTWSTGETAPAITVQTAAIISLLLTDANGCTAEDTIAVAFADPGSLDLGPDLDFCGGTTATVDASLPGATDYSWSNGDQGPVLSTGTAGSYWVDVTLGTCTVSDTILLTAIPALVVNLGNDTTLCPGGSLVLEVALPGVQATWQDGSQGNSFLVTTDGVYEVEITDGTGCTGSDDIVVSYLATTGFTLGADTTICTGSTLLLDAGMPGGATQWSGAGTATGPTYGVTTSGLYIASTTVSGCAFTDSILVQVVDPVMPDLGPDTSFCAGQSMVLSVPGQGLLWDDGTTGGTRTITQGGVYWVQATEDGCTASDTVQVTEVPLPVVDLGPDTSVCGNATFAVSAAVPGGSYLWNDGSTAAVRSLPPGVWTVSVTVDGCTAGDDLAVQGIPLPDLHLPADTTLCAPATWTIDVAQDNASYLWNTGSTAPALPVDAAGTYTVTVTKDGCEASASVDVEVVDLSGFSLGNDTVLCPGATLLLSVDIPGASVLWQDGLAAPQRMVSADGEFQATVTLGGCSAQSAMAVDYVSLPVIDLGVDRESCIGDTVLLSVDPGPASVLWSTGATGPQLAVTTTGTYAVTIGQDGCTASDAVHILFRPELAQIDLGPDRELCPGTSLLLDAHTPGAAAFAWSDGSTGPTLAITAPDTYTVHVTGYCINATGSIRIDPGICTPLIHVPNAFTPDGDGRNDVFRPVIHETVDQWELHIFNRWGELIFASGDPDAGWDGNSQGQEAPQGIYNWHLRYKSLTPVGIVQEERYGHVTLLR